MSNILKTTPSGERKLPHTDPMEPDYPSADAQRGPSMIALSKLLSWVKKERAVNR